MGTAMQSQRPAHSIVYDFQIDTEYTDNGACVINKSCGE